MPIDVWETFFKSKDAKQTRGHNPPIATSNNMDRAIFITSSSTNLSVSLSFLSKIASSTNQEVGGGAIFLDSSQHYVMYQNVFSACIASSNGDGGGQSCRIRLTKSKKVIENSIERCGIQSVFTTNAFVFDDNNLYFQGNNVTNNVLSETCCGHSNTNGYMAYSNFVGNKASSGGLRSFATIVYSKINLVNNNINERGLVQYNTKLYIQDSIIQNNAAT